MKNSKSLVVAILVFIVCLCVGFWIARHKGLWNDELYSQVSSVYGTSYAGQFSGRIQEGGNAPLFYSLQKLFLQMIHYQVPSQWLKRNWVEDNPSRTLLRINPVIFMSLSVALVFYYFSRRYALWTGILSLLIYISSYMLWAYWAEARPYALVVFLTTVQSVILLNRIDQGPRRDEGRAWLVLAGANILLSLTFVLSLGQILAVSLVWWMLKERDWKKYIALTLIPAVIILFYYAQAPKYKFFFGSLIPEQLIRDNIARQIFDVVFIFLISLSVYFWGQKSGKLKNTPGPEILSAVPYLIFLGLVLASSAAVLVSFAMHSTPGQGFPITSRYFIYLTPIGVIAATLLSVLLIKSLSKHRLMQWLLSGLFVFLYIQHFLKIVPGTIHSIMKG